MPILDANLMHATNRILRKPIIGAGEMDPQLEKQVRDGFNLLYGKLDAPGADHVLMLAQQEAQLKQNVCGEALATWGMAQAARSYKLQDAMPRYRKAEELFRRLKSPMALAHAHSVDRDCAADAGRPGWGREGHGFCP